MLDGTSVGICVVFMWEEIPPVRLGDHMTI